MSNQANITVCFWQGQKDIIEQAAKNRNMTMADWIREELMPLAARDAGVRLPVFPPFAKRGRGSGVYRAASELGITSATFRQQAAEQAAQVILDKLAATRPLAASPTLPAQAPESHKRHKVGER